MDWEKHRTREMLIDLSSAFFAAGGAECRQLDTALEFLHNIEKLEPVRFAQLAAVAIATALVLGQGELKEES